MVVNKGYGLMYALYRARVFITACVAYMVARTVCATVGRSSPDDCASICDAAMLDARGVRIPQSYSNYFLQCRNIRCSWPAVFCVCVCVSLYN